MFDVLRGATSVPRERLLPQALQHHPSNAPDDGDNRQKPSMTL